MRNKGQAQKINGNELIKQANAQNYLKLNSKQYIL